MSWSHRLPMMSTVSLISDYVSKSLNQLSFRPRLWQQSSSNSSKQLKEDRALERYKSSWVALETSSCKMGVPLSWHEISV